MTVVSSRCWIDIHVSRSKRNLAFFTIFTKVPAVQCLVLCLLPCLKGQMHVFPTVSKQRCRLLNGIDLCCLLRTLNSSRERRVIARRCAKNTFNYYRTGSSVNKVQSGLNGTEDNWSEEEEDTDAVPPIQDTCMNEVDLERQCNYVLSRTGTKYYKEEVAVAYLGRS